VYSLIQYYQLKLPRFLQHNLLNK